MQSRKLCKPRLSLQKQGLEPSGVHFHSVSVTKRINTWSGIKQFSVLMHAQACIRVIMDKQQVLATPH